MKTRQSANVAALFALCCSAFGQCSNEDEATATAIALKQELTTLQEAQQTAMKNFHTRLERKAEESGWTKEQKIEFLREASQTAQYASFELLKKEQLLQIAAFRKELNQLENKSDALASCKIGLKIAAPMRSIGEVNAKQIRYLLERLESNSK